MIDESSMQHGMHYAGQDVSGWIASEKFDGCRAFWDGQSLWSRGGIDIRIPDEWRDALPAGMPLDGEVYFGVDGQRKCASAIRYGRFLPGMRFMAFDAPNKPGNWSDRLGCIPSNSIVAPVEFQKVENIHHALEMMKQVQAVGGEGLMLRHPDLDTVQGRTDRLLKLKRVPD